jgi:MFS family permease
MPNGRWAVAVYAPTIFFAMMPYGAASAGVQELVPARLRGQAAALFLFTANLLGGSVGPILIGALTKYVFDGNLRIAMVTATAVAVTLASTLYFLGLKPYRETVAAAAK